MTKFDKNRTNVYIPFKLKEAAKKQGINLSKFFTEMLEYELYQENSEFIQKKLEELDQKHTKEHDLLFAKLKVAEDKQRTKKERIEKFKPKIRRYGEIIEGDD